MKTVIENSKNLFGYFELTLQFYIKFFFIRILMKRKETKEYDIEKYSKHAILSNFYHILLPICRRQFYKNFLTLRFITIDLTYCYTATTNH